MFQHQRDRIFSCDKHDFQNSLYTLFGKSDSVLTLQSTHSQMCVKIIENQTKLGPTFSKSSWFLRKKSCFSSTHLESWQRTETWDWFNDDLMVQILRCWWSEVIHTLIHILICWFLIQPYLFNIFVLMTYKWSF